MNFSCRKLIFNFAGFSFFQSWVINQGSLHFSIQKNGITPQMCLLVKMENLIEKQLTRLQSKGEGQMKRKEEYIGKELF